MAYDIGPRIGIEGEVDFRKAINDIISTQRTLATEMDAVSSAFDKNDQSEEALTARNEVLTKQIETQRQKLAALQKGLEAAAERYGENDRVTQGWQQAVNRATADLNRMERQLSDNNAAIDEVSSETAGASQAIDDLGDSMGNAGERASLFGDVLSANLVTDGLEKVAESTKEAAKSILEFAMTSDSSVGKLQAQLGLTEDQAADLSAVAETVWSNGFGDNLEEATESVATIRQSLGDMAEDEMGSITQSALTIKKVFGTDVNESIKTVKTMVQNFGISASDAFDLITVGYQNGLDYSGEFLDTLNEYSPQFKSMGLSADQAMQLLIQGSQNGAFSLDKVADAMKEFNIRIKDGSTTTQQGLEALGINFQELTTKLGNGSITTGEAMQLVIDKLNSQHDTVKRNTAGVDLFGTQWEDLGAEAVLSMGNISNSLSGVEGATKRAGDAANDNIRAKFEIAFRGVQEAIEPLAEQVLDFANNIMPQVEESLQWVSNHSSEIAAGVASIATATVGLKALSVVNGITESWKAYKIAVEGATVAQWALDAAQAANPIGLIVVALAALVAGIIVLWNTNEGFRNAVIGAWTVISTTAQAVWGAIVTFFTVTIPGAITSAISWFSQLPANIGTIFGQIPLLVSNFFTAALASITAFGSNIINWVATEIPLFINSFINFMNELPGEIGYALGFVLGTIVKFGVDALNWVVAEVPKIITGIITFFTDLPGKIATEFMNVITKFGEWGSNVISWITTNVPNFIMGIVNFYAELPGKVYSFLTQVVTNMGTWISNMASKVASGIPGIVSSIINFFKDLPGDMLNIGENLVKGLWNGMTGMTTWLKDKIKEFADGVIHGMKDALGIHSPSRVMRDEVGLMIGLGMAAGIDDSIRQVKSAMARLNRNIVSDAEITTNANVTTQGSSNSRLGRITSSFTGPLLHVDKIVISNDMDIQELANKLGFYYKQVTAAKGGG